MIKIENVSTVGWEAAIRGARNPMNSWEKSDSLFYDYYDDSMDDVVYHTISEKNLLKRIDAWDNDISWTELGLKIGPNDLKLLTNLAKSGSDEAKFRRMIVVYLDVTAPMYWWKEADTLIQLLPSSYNQRATLMLNYEVLANMYHDRKNHKLDEWREFCAWIETLPYAKELIIGFQMRTDIYEPVVLSKNHIKVKVCADKDGVIELRRGVPDLYLGDGVDWAQVRIQVDHDHYIKGMAVYTDDMPEDCDVIVNVRDEGEAFKDLDYKCAFSRYSYQKLKQIFYKDPSTGDFKLSPINIVSDSFDWAEWSKLLPTTFLSKEKEQELIKEADEHLRKGGVDIPEEEENKS